jgi:polar amino acid transport system substrate-binding protein
VTYYLFRLTTRDDIKVVNLADAKTWKIGVVNEHIHHQFLKDKGFENLQAVNSNYQNIQKALLGRIDVFPMSDGGLMQLCSRDDLDCSSFKPILRLDGISNGLYLAANMSKCFANAYCALRSLNGIGLIKIWRLRHKTINFNPIFFT